MVPSLCVFLAMGATTVVARDHPLAAAPETRAEAQQRAERLFDRLDLNHDGKLDRADRAIRANAAFDRIDTNHDGAISRQEFLAAHDHGDDGDRPGPDGPALNPPDGPGLNPPDGPGVQPPDGHGLHPPRGHDGRDGRRLVFLILDRADPGHTGVVTRDSFVHAALALFDRADANHDGVLTPEERRAAMEMLHEHGGGHRHDGPTGPGAAAGHAPPAPAG